MTVSADADDALDADADEAEAETEFEDPAGPDACWACDRDEITWREVTVTDPITGRETTVPVCINHYFDVFDKPGAGGGEP